MSDFAARCTACGFTWNTPVMADGLRVLGACPKCRGELEFGSRAGAASEPPAPALSAHAPSSDAPHLVLGIPRL